MIAALLMLLAAALTDVASLTLATGPTRLLLTAPPLLFAHCLLVAAAWPALRGKRASWLSADLLAAGLLAAVLTLMAAALGTAALGTHVTTGTVLIGVNAVLIAGAAQAASLARRRPHNQTANPRQPRLTRRGLAMLPGTARAVVALLAAGTVAAIVATVLGPSYTPRLLPGPQTPAVYLSDPHAASPTSLVIANPGFRSVTYTVTLGSRQTATGGVAARKHKLLVLPSPATACRTSGRVTVSDPSTGSALATLAFWTGTATPTCR